VNDVRGTWTLVRLALRRDRILVPSLMAVAIVTVVSGVASTIDLYPTVASRVDAARSANASTALVALYGRVYDERSLGGIGSIKMFGLGTIFVALLASLLVIRYTRSEEETGRSELIGAGVVGRAAPLGAALLVASGISLVSGVLCGLGMTAAGLPFDGSMAFGLAWAGIGIVFAAVGALAAQLASSQRAAAGLAAGVLGVFYVLRAVGDTATAGGPRWVSWLSPVGWAQQVRPYGGDRWAVLLLLVAATASITALAFVALARRDLGAGLMPDRPGQATAHRSFAGVLALAWRLQRRTLLAWAALFVVLGAVVGSLAGNLGGLLNSQSTRDFVTKLGGVKSLNDAFVATELTMAGVIAAAAGIQAALRLRTEEIAGHTEALLATAATRTRWSASQTAVALATSCALAAAGGSAAAAVIALRTDAAMDPWDVVKGALVQIPAMAVLIGIAVVLFGLAPRLAAGAWIVLAGFVLLGEFGPLFELPQSIMDASPFAHTPRIPGHGLTILPLAALTLIAATLITVGIAAFHRRDLIT
jgi:ABC-2 type transport system permease protein